MESSVSGEAHRELFSHSKKKKNPNYQIKTGKELPKSKTLNDEYNLDLVKNPFPGVFNIQYRVLEKRQDGSTRCLGKEYPKNLKRNYMHVRLLIKSISAVFFFK